MFYVYGYIFYYFVLNFNRVILLLNFFIDIARDLRKRDFKMAFWGLVGIFMSLAWELGILYLLLTGLKWLIQLIF